MKDDLFKSTIHSVAPAKLNEMRNEMFDLRESGQIHLQAANQFQAGLDKVVDVLLILVLKFGRATSALLVIGTILMICLVTLIVATTQVVSLRSEVRDLLDRQEEFAKSQQRIEKTAAETQKNVETTTKSIAETQAKVDNVAENTPKVEIDKRTGKAKLVVPKKGPAKEVPSKGLELKLE